MLDKVYYLVILYISYLSINASGFDCKRPNWIACDNGRCINTVFECDGDDDCGDATDEKNCNNFTFTLPIQRCAEDEFQCKDHACIPIEKFCDNKNDCPDSSDEYKDCTEQLKCSEFRCHTGHCVRNEWVCDGIADCPDKSDELNCESKPVPVDECNEKRDHFLCKNRRCVFLGAVCNKKDDCGDGSDEDVEGCAKAEAECTKTARCNQLCRRTPNGPICSCKPGYKLIENVTCTDINECEISGICDQHCINNDGSYACACQLGYVIQDDRKTCKAEGGEALMVFSTMSEIRGFYLNSQIYYPVTENLHHAVHVSLDANYLYWSDIENDNEAIFRSREDGSQQEVIVSAGLGKPEGIAVDWVTGNIYFADASFMHIGVCTNNGSYCTVIIRTQTGTPRDIVLLPSNGILYWSEWGVGSQSHISMAGMDGNGTMPFIKTGSQWPDSLAIDYANKRLYWIDSKLKIIESVRLDGSDRRIVFRGIAKHPFSLAVFENKLYWSDWSSNTIQSCDKFTGKDWNIMLRLNSSVYGLHIFHSVLKPKMRNPCNAEPCSQLCLLNRNSGYTCACSLDSELTSDGHNCQVLKKKEHIVIAAGKKFISYYHEILGTPKTIARNEVKRVTAMTYDPIAGAILVSDQLSDEIFYYHPKSGILKSIISLRNKLLGGMDFDYIGNNLYFTDMEHNTIEVHSLITQEKTVFYFEEQPSDIALAPAQGIMFVVFLQGGKYRIDKMQMNGIGLRYTITGNTLTGPKVSLYYDKDTNRIFWSDQGTGRIESTTPEGTDRHLFRTGLIAPVSLTVLEERIFWTERGSNRLYWANKKNNDLQQKRITLSDVPRDVDIMHLVTMHGLHVTQNHTCRQNNGNCSHVCLISNLDSHICACPPNMMLNPDNRSCNPETMCAEGEVKCQKNNTCIKRHQLCDGVPDCPLGEDESEDCINLFSCGKEQYKCKSGECIERKKRCNSHYDCMDRSDEEDCDKKECQTSKSKHFLTIIYNIFVINRNNTI